MISLNNKIIAITGASSGIGLSCARAFAVEGSRLVLLARRKERIDALGKELTEKHGVPVFTARLDVRKQADVARTFESLPSDWKTIDILVNNAGLSRGLNKLQDGKTEDWDEMIDTNVKGLLYVTHAVLPGMVERNSGHIINIGSIAGEQTYPAGNVYCASKFAVTGLTRSLKMDLLGTAVRVSSVDPGLVQTEFSRVRFRGDAERAAKTYAGMTPLHPDDVAEVVVFCATRPPHVDITEVTVMPTDQASVTLVHRTT
jgi:3-hydroxy acid dehydrogenase/malonic semialdehyde reductase